MGINLRFRPFVGIYEGMEYPSCYKRDELKAFRIKPNGVGGLSAFIQYKKKCNAGYNFGAVSPDGEIQKCLFINENMGNIYKKINFRKCMTTCHLEFCACPINLFDPPLFRKAMEDMDSAEWPGVFTRLASILKDRKMWRK